MIGSVQRQTDGSEAGLAHMFERASAGTCVCGGGDGEGPRKGVAEGREDEAD